MSFADGTILPDSWRREEPIKQRTNPLISRRKVLILGVSVGSGHMRAADAVAMALKKASENITVCVEDFLDYGGRPYRLLYRNAYLFLARRLPGVLDRLYKWTDVMPTWLSRILPWADSLVFRRFVASLTHDPPDLILCTHFLPLEILAPLRQNGSLSTPLWGIVTDIHPHGIWIWPGVDQYYACGEESQKRILERIPQTSVFSSGIPILSDFSEKQERMRLLERLGLPDRRTILILSGGEGVEDLPSILDSFRGYRGSLTLVAIAGNNKPLQVRCRNWERIHGSPDLTVKALGFVKNMQEWMALSDIVVTKPGGLTIFEAMASGKPLVLLPARGGQERINREWAISIGSSVGITIPSEAGSAVCALFDDPVRFKKLTSASVAAGRPEAALHISQEIMRTLESREPALKGGSIETLSLDLHLGCPSGNAGLPGGPPSRISSGN